MYTNEMNSFGTMTRPPTILERKEGVRDEFHGSTTPELGVHILEKLIKQNYLDDMNLLESSRLFGKENLTAILNQRIHNDRFTVELDFSESEEPVIMGLYVGFSLQLHELIIPKSALSSLTEDDIDKAFEVAGYGESDDHTIGYKVFLHETWNSNTIGQLVKAINCHLGPYVEKEAKKLKLTEYRMVFKVGVSF